MDKRPILLLKATFIFLFLGIVEGYSQEHPFIDNPVLPGVADAGVIKFNGEYYIGGVFTNGGFFFSKDLVEWEGPMHVFSMDNDWTEGPSAGDDQIHANDIHYINGVFHQYWSVNYWGKDQHVVHIGHATSSDILGPYREPVKETWFGDRIDPHLFLDDDGKAYLYMVKFTEGNTIWARPMIDPYTFGGEPHYLFSSLPNSWETLDNRVAEGPWVVKYRDRYYLLYNTNHTSTSWGNYTIGVAEADSPLGFNKGSKYPHPVLQSNQIAVEENFVDLLDNSTLSRDAFQYAFKQPAEGWTEISFNDSSWHKGKQGFGSSVIKNSTTREVKTLWKSPQLWARKTFSLESLPSTNLVLRMHHDGETMVWLNGGLVYSGKGRKYINHSLGENAYALLQEGENVLAIQSAQGSRSAFLDVSFFDMKDQKVDDILFSPGQPNLVRGPNGFEWWLVYMANKNAEKRGQYINRVHFFNKKLVVDGITGINSEGYHPLPAAPTFRDLFNHADRRQWQNKWETRSGEWVLQNKEIIQVRKGISEAWIKSISASHYLFEVGIKMDKGTKTAGIIAWWQDNDHWLKVVLDQESQEWAYIINYGKEVERHSFPLPEGFKFDVFHSLKVLKNNTRFTLEIDGLPAPHHPVIENKNFSGKGIPGLYANGPSAFDGLLYTIGWDEFDQGVTGWGPSLNGAHQKGSWRVTEEGISSPDGTGENIIFKGDELMAYEISLQITSDSHEGTAGIFPVYVDQENYLKAAFDFERQKLMVSGKRNGVDIESKSIGLNRSQSYYADVKYSDFIKKHFSFDSPTIIDRIRWNKIPHGQPDTRIEDLSEKVNIFYLQENKWKALTDFDKNSSQHPDFQEINFEPIEAEALKFVNKVPDDHHYYIYKIGLNEIFKQSFNLRVVRIQDAIIFVVDGKEVMQLKVDFPASQIGLHANRAAAQFNGITFFHLPKDF